MKLSSILQDSDYQLTQVPQTHITRLENSIFLKASRGKQIPYVKGLVRQSDIQLKPEQEKICLY